VSFDAIFAYFSSFDAFREVLVLMKPLISLQSEKIEIVRELIVHHDSRDEAAVDFRKDSIRICYVCFASESNHDSSPPTQLF
jgi:hypothetical protein